MSLLTNASAQTALSTLRGVQSNLQETQDRISTGLKVRGPKENPAFFLVAQTVRGDLALLGGIRENLTIGVNAAKTADAGVRDITSAINTIQESLATAESGAALGEIQFSIDELIGGIEDQVNGTNFNGVNLLQGVSTTTITTGIIRDGGAFKISTFTLQAQNLDSLELAGRQGAAPIYATDADAQAQFDSLYQAYNPGFADRLDVNGDGSVDLTVGGVDDLGVGAGATDFTFYGSQEDIDFLASVGVVATNLGKVGPDNTRDVINIDLAAGFNGNEPDDFEASVVAGAVQAFADVETLLQNAVFSDQNLKAFADGSGFRAVARQIEVADAALGNTSSAMVVADSLISRVNITQATIGIFDKALSDRQNFLDALTDSLELGVAALVEADLDEESSRLQSLQVQEQLAIQSLTIANQRPQNILALFR